jgi:hypothetical protein
LISSSFFTTSNKTWQYLGTGSINNIRLGVIKAYDYGESLNQYIQLNINNDRLQILTGEDDVLSRAVNMIVADRIDKSLHCFFAKR